MAHVGPAPQ